MKCNENLQTKCELYCEKVLKHCKLKDEFVSENSEGKEKPASWTQFLHVTNHTGHRVAGCLPIFVAGTLHTPSLQGNWTGGGLLLDGFNAWI